MIFYGPKKGNESIGYRVDLAGIEKIPVLSQTPQNTNVTTSVNEMTAICLKATVQSRLAIPCM
jgi:hypothetical protein